MLTGCRFTIFFAATPSWRSATWDRTRWRTTTRRGWPPTTREGGSGAAPPVDAAISPVIYL